MKRLFFLLLWVSAAVAQTSSNLLVLEKNDRTLAVVDLDSSQVVGRVPAGEDPHEVVASEDGQRAYISNYGAFGNPQHTISVVDLAARKALPAIDLGALLAPHGMELADGKVYFTAEGSKVIGRYDPATQRVDWALGIGQNRTHMLVVSKDGSRIFTSNVNSDSISILEHAKTGDASGWIETPVPVGKGPEGFDVSPDGKELWAANSHDGTVSVVDVENKKVLQTLSVSTKFANRLKFTPDGMRVLISDLGTGDVLVIDVAGRKETKRLNVGHGAAGILMSPDGSKAYIAVSPDSNIAILDLNSLAVIGRIQTGKGPDGMAWARAAK